MSLLKIVFIYLWVIGFSGCVTSSKSLREPSSQILNQNSKFQQFQQFVESEMSTAKAAGLAVVIIQNGQITYSSGFGEEDRGSGRKIQNQTLFELQSFTKTVTAACALELVREGKLNLNAPVSRYVPEFKLPVPWDADAITVRNVMMMTAGIVGFPSNLNPNALPFDETKPEALRNFVNLVQQEPLLIAPGLLYNYSNAGYGLLGLILERASGKNYSSIVAEKVLKTARMNQATFENSIARMRPHAFVHGRSANGNNMSADQTLANDTFYSRPWGGLYGSIEDVGRFGLFLLNNRIDQMTRDQAEKEIPNNSYGYGLHLQKRALTGNASDDLVVWAAGNGPGIGVSSAGFASHLYLVPNKRFAVGIISNDGDFQYQKIVSKAFELFLGQDRIPFTPVKTSPVSWSIYEGTYSGSQMTGDIQVILRDQKLFLSIPKLQFTTELIQYSESMFIWANLPQLWLNQNGLTAVAYNANPIFSSSFMRRPNSITPQTDFIVSRLVIGVRKN